MPWPWMGFRPPGSLRPYPDRPGDRRRFCLTDCRRTCCRISSAHALPLACCRKSGLRGRAARSPDASATIKPARRLNPDHRNTRWRARDRRGFGHLVRSLAQQAVDPHPASAAGVARPVSQRNGRDTKSGSTKAANERADLFQDRTRRRKTACETSLGIARSVRDRATPPRVRTRSGKAHPRPWPVGRSRSIPPVRARCRRGSARRRGRSARNRP